MIFQIRTMLRPSQRPYREPSCVFRGQTVNDRARRTGPGPRTDDYSSLACPRNHVSAPGRSLRPAAGGGVRNSNDFPDRCFLGREKETENAGRPAPETSPPVKAKRADERRIARDAEGQHEPPLRSRPGERPRKAPSLFAVRKRANPVATNAPLPEPIRTGNDALASDGHAQIDVIERRVHGDDPRAMEQDDVLGLARRERIGKGGERAPERQRNPECALRDAKGSDAALP